MYCLVGLEQEGEALLKDPSVAVKVQVGFPPQSVLILPKVAKFTHDPGEGCKEKGKMLVSIHQNGMECVKYGILWHQ